MEIAIKNSQRLIKANNRTIKKVLRRALAHLAHKDEHSLLSAGQILQGIEVSVLLVNDAQMRRLNRLHRGVDRTTDVLSFPQQTSKKLKVRSKKLRTSHFSLLTSYLFLGDIVISLPRVRRQAKEYMTTFYAELARLLVHGLLHLLGYDHEKNRYQAAKMRRLEAELAEVTCL
jgi:probable rRNA maturation factor